MCLAHHKKPFLWGEIITHNIDILGRFIVLVYGVTYIMGRGGGGGVVGEK